MPNTIAQENTLPGTPQSIWDLPNGVGSSNIEGFATDISVNHGDTISFKINTDSTNYRIDIYRLGYYNGDGARIVASLNHSGSSPVVQPNPLTDPKTGLVDAGNWSVTDTWNIPADSVSGVYIADLIRQDGEPGMNQIPFIVRADESTSDVIFQTSDETWQAYNSWGGVALYNGINGSVRADAVSYNRPFDTRTSGFGWSYLFSNEFPAVQYLEKNGFDVSYISEIDAARNGGLLLNHNAFISVGHDEYWSAEQYNSVKAARDSGVNLVFWSGNEIAWKTELLPSIDGTHTPFRTVVTYKTTQTGNQNPDGVWTGAWTDPNAPADQGIRPPNELTGTLTGVNGANQTMQIPYEQTQLSIWNNTAIQRNTQPGQTAAIAPNNIGNEYDIVADNGYLPRGLIELASTSYDVPKMVIDYVTNEEGSGTANYAVTLYRAPSGALVFSAGDVFWAWNLTSNHDPFLSSGGTVNGDPDPNIQQAMINLFGMMGIKPATLDPNLVAGPAGVDTSGPSISDASLMVMGDGTMLLQGTASDAETKVAGVTVSTDSGNSWHPGVGAGAWSYTLATTSGPTGDVLVSSVDDVANVGSSLILPKHITENAIVDGANAFALATIDSTQAEPWSVVWNGYNAQGQWDMQDVQFDDGSRGHAVIDPTQADWFTDNYTYNSNGELTTHFTVAFDSSNNQPWAETDNYYDDAGRWIGQIVRYDDGSTSQAVIDPNQTNWYSDNFNYDDSGNFASRYQHILDQSNNQPWTEVDNWYDAAGNWVTQSVTYNDGTTSYAIIDPTQAAWWSDNYNYNADGSFGSHFWVVLDPQNEEPWSQTVNYFDPAGEWVMQDVTYNDGSTSHAIIDPLKTDWYTDNYNYNVNGNLTSHFQVLADGSVMEFPVA